MDINRTFKIYFGKTSNRKKIKESDCMDELTFFYPIQSLQALAWDSECEDGLPAESRKSTGDSAGGKEYFILYTLYLLELVYLYIQPGSFIK